MTVERNLCLVGWSYRHWPVRRLFEAAGDYGYPWVELRTCADVDLCSEACVRAGLRAAAACAEATGVRVGVVDFHQFVVTEADALRRRNPLLFDADILAGLRDAGAPTVLLMLERVRADGSHALSSDEASEEDFAACREGLEVLGETLEPYGLRAAVELHAGTIADTLEGALWTSATLDHALVGVCLDFANMLDRAPHANLVEAVGALRERILYTHLKNLIVRPWGHDPDLPIEMGSIDYFGVLSALEQHGYGGLLGVEYVGHGDPDVFARRDADYLRWLGYRLDAAARWRAPDGHGPQSGSTPNAPAGHN
jgi:sugar phosphate isomerase/epimerase